MLRRQPLAKLAALTAAAFLAVACGSAGATGQPSSGDGAVASPEPASSPQATQGSQVPLDPSGSPTDAGEAPTIDRPWATAELIDVVTGEPFRIADLAGQVVIVETMAVWCSNCFAQQREIYDALGDLGPERVAYVLIDVDPSESAEELAAYRDGNGFTGTYAVATPDVARALIDEFGEQVVNPPSTPKVFIGSDGTVGEIMFGSTRSDEIVEIARSLGA